MFGIALARCEVPEALIRRHALKDRVTRRREEADEEIHFLSVQRPRLLPVWIDGQLLILSWGRSDVWCPQEALEAGSWPYRSSEQAVIPATFGCDRGVWYPVPEGLKGVVVEYSGRKLVYPISTTSNHYYEVMTRQRRMPLFAGIST